MITRSKLVEQLRDYQIRSEHKYTALTIFSPKPNIATCLTSVIVLEASCPEVNAELDSGAPLAVLVYMRGVRVDSNNGTDYALADVAVAILWGLVFSVLVVSSYVTLYFRHFWLSFLIICVGVLLPIRLRVSRQSLARKRDRRLMLPLSM
ncbi:hypothetical protein RJ640_011111 [Escallonia rubra]|uniref:Uncharacterized protein n=1 Tax=Escallonia rubra TaxID=112253 RepID=A0AA88RLX0_9ASTE|nr:hypothetical protein RJ640_011111 [Escallonia rubra]